MRILVLEDDHLQSQSVREALEANLPDVCVEEIHTESEFLDGLERLKEEPPDLAIIDIIIRWAEPAPEMPSPPEHAQNRYTAGMRCVKALLAEESTKGIPIIVHTVRERAELADQLASMPENVLFLGKTGDLDRLVLHIRSSLERLPDSASGGFAKRLWRSLELKPGWGGVSVDLKRIFRSRSDRKRED